MWFVVIVHSEGGIATQKVPLLFPVAVAEHQITWRTLPSPVYTDGTRHLPRVRREPRGEDQAYHVPRPRSQSQTHGWTPDLE